VRDGIDLKIELASSAYATEEIVNGYIDNVVILAVISSQDPTRCKDEQVVLLCSNSSAHYSDEVLNKLVRDGILVIPHRPHISRIFQVLGVLLFGILKRAKKCQPRDDALRRDVDHVL
jgi:hypothetical protein